MTRSVRRAWRLAALPLISLIGVSLSAQVGPTRVGVLLGLRTEGGYRTLWIRQTADGLKLVKALPGLVVPHGASVCWIVTTHASSIATGYGRGSVYTNQYIGLRCSAALPKPVVETNESCSGDRRLIVLSASSSHVSLRKVESSNCNGHSNSYETLSVLPLASIEGRWFDSGTGSPGMDSVDASIVEALRKSASVACRALDKDLRPVEWESCDVSPESWGVTRGRGEWRISGHSIGTRETDLEYDVPLTGVSGLRLWTRMALSPQMLASLPSHVVDFVTAPGDALALVLASDAIHAATVKGGALNIGAKLAKRDSDETIVSIEWALGPHVAEWDKLVRALNPSHGRIQDIPAPEATPPLSH